MSSRSEEEFNLEEIHVNDLQESDNEEMINYLSSRILAMEESFIQICKNKNFSEQRSPHKDDFQNQENQDDSFHDLSFGKEKPNTSKFSKHLPENKNLNFKENFISYPSNKLEFKYYNNSLQDHYNYTDLIHQLFNEIHLINETLMKVVKSNYEKNEKLCKVVNKFKKMVGQYKTLKLNNHLLSENLSMKDIQLINLEEVIKAYEHEISILRNKEISEFNRREDSNHLSNLNLYNTFSNFGSGGKFGSESPCFGSQKFEDNFNLKETKEFKDFNEFQNYNSERMNLNLNLYEEAFKILNIEKEDLKSQIQNLQYVIFKKEEFTTEISNELQRNIKLLNESKINSENLINEKFRIKNEFEALKKENILLTEYIENLNIKKLDPQEALLMKNKIRKLNTLPDKEFNLEDINFHDNPNFHLSKKICIEDDSINNFMLEDKNEGKNSSDSDSYKQEGQVIIRRTRNSDKSEQSECEKENNHIGICLDNISLNKSSLSVNNFLNLNAQINKSQIQSPENIKQDEGAFTLKKRARTNICLTTSLNNIENGLKSTKQKLKFDFNEKSFDGENQGILDKIYEAVKTPASFESSSNLRKNSFSNLSASKFKQLKFLSYKIIKSENLNFISENKFLKHSSDIRIKEICNSSNINNIININFNNFDEGQNSSSVTEEQKKVFFEILYDSLKLNKHFNKLVEEVSKEEIYNNIVNKNIPVYKFYTYITNYLRKSKPNILYNFVKKDTVEERMTKFLRSYRKEVNKWKYKNQKINRKLNKMSEIITELKNQKIKLSADKFEEIENMKQDHNKKQVNVNYTCKRLPQSKIIFTPIEETNDKMNVNISILNGSMTNPVFKKEPIRKRKFNNLSCISQNHNLNSSRILDEKLLNFSNIFEKMTSKFQEVGQAVNTVKKASIPKHDSNKRRTNNLLDRSMIDSPEEILIKNISPNHSRVISNSHIESFDTSKIKRNSSPCEKKMENSILGDISIQRGSNLQKFQYPQLSLRPIKEICIKICSYHHKTHFEPYKLVIDYLDNHDYYCKSIQNRKNAIQFSSYQSNNTSKNYQTSGSQQKIDIKNSHKNSSNLTASLNEESNPSQDNPLSSKKKNYNDDIKNLYKKYFKYSDNFMKDTLKDSPGQKKPEYPNLKEIRSTVNKKLGLNGIVKYTPQISQLSQEKLNLMSYLKTSIYLNSIVNRSNWVKNKDLRFKSEIE